LTGQVSTSPNKNKDFVFLGINNDTANGITQARIETTKQWCGVKYMLFSEPYEMKTTRVWNRLLRLALYKSMQSEEQI
jgi:hypothetical protein